MFGAVFWSGSMLLVHLFVPSFRYRAVSNALPRFSDRRKNFTHMKVVLEKRHHYHQLFLLQELYKRFPISNDKTTGKTETKKTMITSRIIFHLVLEKLLVF